MLKYTERQVATIETDNYVFASDGEGWEASSKDSSPISKRYSGFIYNDITNDLLNAIANRESNTKLSRRAKSLNAKLDNSSRSS